MPAFKTSHQPPIKLITQWKQYFHKAGVPMYNHSDAYQNSDTSGFRISIHSELITVLPNIYPVNPDLILSNDLNWIEYNRNLIENDYVVVVHNDQFKYRDVRIIGIVWDVRQRIPVIRGYLREKYHYEFMYLTIVNSLIALFFWIYKNDRSSHKKRWKQYSIHISHTIGK